MESLHQEHRIEVILPANLLPQEPILLPPDRGSSANGTRVVHLHRLHSVKAIDQKEQREAFQYHSAPSLQTVQHSKRFHERHRLVRP